MVRLTRTRSIAAIPAPFRDPVRAAREGALLGAGATTEFQAAWWKGAKTQLRRESGGNCAYCQAATDTVAHGDVEHIRPKSAWWWLALCWDNYAFACQVCNQVYKGDRFEHDGPRMIPAPAPGGYAPDPLDAAAVAAFAKACAAESPRLPHPYFDDPEVLFAWDDDEVLGEVRLIPHPGDAASARAVDAAERILGLNREPLLRARFAHLAPLKLLTELLPSAPPVQAARIRRQIGSACRPRAPFSAMVRYFARNWPP